GGVASLTVTGETAGSITITASKSGLTSGSSTFAVTTGAANHLTFTSDTSSVASGSAKTLAVEVRDANGNLETADNTTVGNLAKTAGAGTVTGLGTAPASGGVVTLAATGHTAGAITVTAHASGLADATSSFNVLAGSIDGGGSTVMAASGTTSTDAG